MHDTQIVIIHACREPASPFVVLKSTHPFFCCAPAGNLNQLLDVKYQPPEPVRLPQHLHVPGPYHGHSGVHPEDDSGQLTVPAHAPGMCARMPIHSAYLSYSGPCDGSTRPSKHPLCMSPACWVSDWYQSVLLHYLLCVCSVRRMQRAVRFGQLDVRLPPAVRHCRRCQLQF